MKDDLFFNKQFYEFDSEFLNDYVDFENPINLYPSEDSQGFNFNFSARIEIPEHIDFDNFTKESLAILIAKNYKSTIGLNEYQKNERDFIKKFNRKAKLMEAKKGVTMLSSFINIYVNRKERYDVTNDIRQKEFTNNPLDISYIHSSKDLISLLKKGEKIRKEKFEIKNCNKKNGEIPDCMDCDGSGYEHCYDCGGSGREEYVAGYFANGNEKIKVGNCSLCHGSGKVKCSTCKGKGKPNIISDDYQIIRFFEDKYRAYALNFIKLPGEKPVTTCSYLDDYKHYLLEEIYEDNFLQKISFKYWSELDESEIKENVLSLSKNEVEKIIEKNINDFNFKTDSEKLAFEENFKVYKKNRCAFGEDIEPITVLCQNISIPTIKLIYSDGGDYNYEVYFFKTFDIKNKPLTIIRFRDNIPYISRWKLLF